MIKGEAQVMQADDRNINQDVLAAVSPVLVGIYAEWCSPCRALDPQLERLAEEMGDRLKVMRLDADRSKAFMEQFNVEGLPTCLLLDDGKEILRIAGIHPYKVLKTHVENKLD